MEQQLKVNSTRAAPRAWCLTKTKLLAAVKRQPALLPARANLTPSSATETMEGRSEMNECIATSCPASMMAVLSASYLPVCRRLLNYTH